MLCWFRHQGMGFTIRALKALGESSSNLAILESIVTVKPLWIRDRVGFSSLAFLGHVTVWFTVYEFQIFDGLNFNQKESHKPLPDIRKCPQEIKTFVRTLHTSKRLLIFLKLSQIWLRMWLALQFSSLIFGEVWSGQGVATTGEVHRVPTRDSRNLLHPSFI